jgi:methylthioribose-1-phosphate isomerase
MKRLMLAAVLATVGCGKGDTAPSTPDAKALYDAELAELNRLEKEREETVQKLSASYDSFGNALRTKYKLKATTERMQKELGHDPDREAEIAEMTKEAAQLEEAKSQLLIKMGKADTDYKARIAGQQQAVEQALERLRQSQH